MANTLVTGYKPGVLLLIEGSVSNMFLLFEKRGETMTIRTNFLHVKFIFPLKVRRKNKFSLNPQTTFSQSEAGIYV